MNDSGKLMVVPPGRGYAAVPGTAFEYMYDEDDREHTSQSVDLRALWSALYRNRYLIAAVLVFSMAAALAAALLTAPVYRATTSLQIDQQTAKILESQDQEPVVSAQESERFLQTQVDVIRSRSLAARVAQSLDLSRDKAFAALLKSDDTTPGEKNEQVVKVLMQGLSVTLPRNSRVVQIHFESTDPAFSAKVANAFAENAIISNLQRRFDTSAYSRQFLEGQLAAAKQRLEQSERQVVAYARSAGLLDMSGGVASGTAPTGGQSLTTSSLVQVNQAYSQARAARIQAEQRWASAQGTPALNLPEVLSNPTIQQLTQKRAELESALEEERQRRLEGHPAIIQATARLAELDRQINSIASSIKNSIREQYDVAARQERGLEGNVGQLRGATLSEQDRSVRYNILRREADTNRQLYDGLLQRYREISAAAGITTNNISIIDPAIIPRDPVWPRPLLNLALGALAGLLLALILVFLREKFDDAVRSPDDVERKLGVPLLGAVPLLKGGTTPQDALEDPRSLLSEAHFALRSSLELATDEGLPSTLLLTSSRPAEGKTTSAYAIARDLALSGKNVLLVDADLRKPSMHRLLGLQNRLGLANLLARQKSFEEVVQPTPIENLLFISSGPLPPNPGQLLTGKALPEIIVRLRQSCDIVVIDGPPVLGLADAPRLSELVDGTVFVVEANGAHHGHSKAALKRLLSSRAKLLGVILTKFDARKAGYKSEYGYYYYEYGSSEQRQIEQHDAA